MKIKLLATDLDGTLLEHKNRIKSNSIKSIKKFKEDKNFLVISTGRHLGEIEFLKNEYGIEWDAAITLNGSVIVDKNKNILIKKYISREILQEIYDTYNKENIDIFFSTEKEVYKLSGSKEYTRNAKFIEEGKINRENIVSFNMNFTDSNKSIGEIDEIVKKIKDKYRYEIDVFRNTRYIDIAPIGCSKGNGVKYISEYFGINKTDVYCIGDSWNDASMFEIAAASATFHNVEEKLKSKVDMVVDEFNDFISKIIEY